MIGDNGFLTSPHQPHLGFWRRVTAHASYLLSALILLVGAVLASAAAVHDGLLAGLGPGAMSVAGAAVFFIIGHRLTSGHWSLRSL